MSRWSGGCGGVLLLALAGAYGCDNDTNDEAGFATARKDAGMDVARGFDAGADVYIIPPTWDGGSAKVLATGVDGIGVATDGTNVYAQGAGGAIFACPIGGCSGETPTQLSTLIGSSSQLETILASDGVATFLTSSGGALSSVAFAHPGDTSTTLQSNGTIGAMVGDGTRIYFTNYIATDGGPSIPQLESCPSAGACSAPRPLYTPASSDEVYSLGPIAVAGADVYFAANGENGSTIDAVATTGGAARTVCSSTMLEGVQSLVSVGDYVYFTSMYEPSAIYACPASGGDAKVFVSDYFPYALATDGTSIFWTNYVPTTGTVAMCAAGATCTAPFTVATMQDAPFAIAASAKGVYWTTGTAIVGASR